MGCITGCNQDELLIVHNPADQASYKLTDFTTARACAPCHPLYFREWEGSMHRYSASDPIWMLANNSLQQSSGGKLGKTCFQCHAPLGFLTDNTVPSFRFSDLDPLVREGVTCDLCHVLRPPYLTTNQRIQYTLEPGPVKYGTLKDPVPTAAHQHGYDPEYDRSNVCRQCHDLIVNNVPVEMTVTEWETSPWGAMSVECQACHMRTYTGRATPDGPLRNNLHRHTFAGVDVAITDFPNKPQQYAEIDSFMKNSATVLVISPSSGAIGDTLLVEVGVYNDKTGHNLPTSVFFNRQMWIELTVWKGTDTVYRSGHLDENGDLMDKNSALRPNEDPDLTIFNGTLFKEGQESNVFELDSLVNRSIPAFGSHWAGYYFLPPATGRWNVKTRLLFRPFGPYLFRALGADEYVTELPIFEMAVHEAIIDVY